MTEFQTSAGDAYIALAVKGGETSVKKVFVGHGRERGRTLAAGHALKLLLDELKRKNYA